MMKSTQRSWRRLAFTAAIALTGLALVTAPCLAINVVEAWRVPVNSPGAVSVYPADGSCWFTSTGRIMRLADDGSLLWQMSGTFSNASVNTKDGSCWATDDTSGQLTHLAADGTQLWQGGNYLFPAHGWLHYLDVSTIDGSVWFGEWNPIGPITDRLVHLGEDGTQLWASTDQMPPVYGVSVNQSDGTCWASTTYWFLVHSVLHFAEDGTLLWNNWAYRPLSVSVNAGDNSVWYTHCASPAGPGSVYHCAEDGTLLWSGEFNDPHAVAVNPRDGSCWVGAGDEVIYLASDGTELWRSSAYGSSHWQGGGSLAVNPKDGSCRISDGGHNYVARLNVVDVPQAAFVATPMTGAVPLTVEFQNWSLGTPTSCLWNFGDGATSTEDNPTHTYNSAGNYNVTLTVSNECGEDTETCCVTCRVPQCATRTPGYWFTHPEALVEAFETITGEEWGTIYLCPPSDCGVTPDDAMAIFWGARGQRATFAKHILAAMFNDALLKPAPDDIIEEALEVLCDPDSTKSEISAALGPLGSYNESGSWLSMNGFNFGHADPSEAKEMASNGTVPGCVQTADNLRRSAIGARVRSRVSR